MGRIPFIDIILLSLRKQVVSFGKHVVFRCNTIIGTFEVFDLISRGGLTEPDRSFGGLVLRG